MNLQINYLKTPININPAPLKKELPNTYHTALFALKSSISSLSKKIFLDYSRSICSKILNNRCVIFIKNAFSQLTQWIKRIFNKIFGQSKNIDEEQIESKKTNKIVIRDVSEPSLELKTEDKSTPLPNNSFLKSSLAKGNTYLATGTKMATKIDGRLKNLVEAMDVTYAGLKYIKNGNYKKGLSYLSGVTLFAINEAVMFSFKTLLPEAAYRAKIETLYNKKMST